MCQHLQMKELLNFCSQTDLKLLSFIMDFFFVFVIIQIALSRSRKVFQESLNLLKNTLLKLVQRNENAFKEKNF
jgi:hypothetical protein